MASLKKNIGASFIGNVVFAISQWLLLIVLVKMGGEHVIGVYALALAVVSPIFAFGNMNLRAIQATDTEKPVSFFCYARFRHMSSLIAILICVSVAAGFYHNKLEICLSIFCLAFYKYFESKSDLVHGYLQKRERMNLIAYSIMVRGVSNFLVIVSMYYYTQDLVQSLASAIFISWAVYYFIDDRNYHRLYKRHDEVHKTSWQLFTVAWPLGIVVFANTLNLNIPRYFIAEFYDESMVGIFASISYFIVAGSTLVNAIGQSAAPRLAKYSVANLMKFSVLSRQIFLLVILIGLIGVLIADYLGQFILRFFYTGSIAEYHFLFIQIMWAGVAIYATAAGGTFLTAMRDFKSQGVIAVGTMLVMVISSFWLVRDYGLPGAAGAIALTHVFKLIMYWFYYIKKRRSLLSKVN